MKGKVIADKLADAPLEDDRPMSIEFPDESILCIEAEPGDEPGWYFLFDGSKCACFVRGHELSSSLPKISLSPCP